MDKIIKDGTLGGVSRSCEIWRSPQEFLPKVWRLTQFFLLLRVGMAAAVAAVADNARMSCRHEQANRFCKLKSGKLKRRKNANLFERVYAIFFHYDHYRLVWFAEFSQLCKVIGCLMTIENNNCKLITE